ncbi:MAG: methyltransferase domain-containing protein [Balneola sp.]
MNKYWTTKASKFHKIDNVERDILLPYVAKIVNELSPKKLLDYGCGNGFLASLLKEDLEISLYDINKEIVNEYKQWNIQNSVKTITEQSDIEKNYYDVVVQTSVIMCIPTIDELMNMFNDIYLALKKGGVFVVVLTHPCFLQYPFGHYYTSLNHDNFNYLEDEKKYQVYMKQVDQESIEFSDFNWNLSTVINGLIKAGLTLTRMIEHPDLKSKYFEPNSMVPPWLFLTAKK